MTRNRLLLIVATLALVLVALWVAPRRASDRPPHVEGAGDPVPNAAGRSRVDVDPAWVRRLGMTVEPAREEESAQIVRAAATVVPDELRVSHVHVRVPGWVEQVHVETGERVRAGQPLVSVFSQELYAAQREYLAVHARRHGSLTSAVLPGSRARLRVLGMSGAQIAALEASGKAPSTLTVHAPHAGVVLRRSISPGTAIDPSTELVTLADLSSVWVEAEIAERDALLAQTGTAARIHWAAMGAEPVDARLDFVSPVITERSRSVRVRVRLANPAGVYRPGLSGTLELRGEPRRQVTVARDAVVDTGQEQYVYVAQPDGGFMPRRVILGARSADRVSVVEGLRAGEPVLSSGVFLVDSESRLRGSGASGAHQGHGGTPDRKREPPMDQAPADDPAQPHAGHRP